MRFANNVLFRRRVATDLLSLDIGYVVSCCVELYCIVTHSNISKGEKGIIWVHRKIYDTQTILCTVSENEYGAPSIQGVNKEWPPLKVAVRKLGADNHSSKRLLIVPYTC